MQPSFLNTPFNFSTFNFNTQIHFQFLNVSVDQKTQPSICFKIHGRAFQTLNQAFQTLDQAFEALREMKSLAESLKNLTECFKSLATSLCYTIAHVVESTTVFFPIYPEVCCQ